MRTRAALAAAALSVLAAAGCAGDSSPLPGSAHHVRRPLGDRDGRTRGRLLQSAREPAPRRRAARAGPDAG
nr:hypothetical protein GCM10020092_044620 [Actinoplanes digitatis]